MLPAYIKSKGIFWKLLPWSSQTAYTIYPNVYLPLTWYNNLTSSKPDIHYLAILKHEEVHRKRWKETGVLLYPIKCLLFPSFRFREELLAYKKQYSFLKEQGKRLNKKKIARYLSGPMYLWATSYEKGLAALEKF